MDWLISANSKIYDHAQSFATNGYIDWRQGNRKYNIGDTVYIYCAKPVKQLLYKTVVEKINLTKETMTDDKQFWRDVNEYYSALDGYFFRLRLLEQADRTELKYQYLLKNGLKQAPQGPIKMLPQLKKYVDKFFDDFYYKDFFPDSADTEKCIEGAKIQIFVNKFERSSIARKKCVEYHGCYCHVCGLDFGDKYGELGNGFIHIHHLIPLNEIKKEYTVDYKKDLIPVCPNCHAMLHRKYGGSYLGIDALKNILNL